MRQDLDLGPTSALWTAVATPTGGTDVERNRLVRDVRQLSGVATAVVAFENRDIDAVFDDARALLSGERLREVSKRVPVSHRWFEKLYATARDAYRLEKGLAHRPARALILIAGEHSFVPLAEGVAAAAAWWPWSARLDLRSAFHVVAQWGFECDPLLARLTVVALTTPAGPLSWPPFEAFYEQMLLPHDRDADRRKTRASELATATVEALGDHYRVGGTNGQVIRRLLQSCEEMRIIKPRARFEPDPSLLRRNELARLVLDFELGREADTETESLLDLLEQDLTTA